MATRSTITAKTEANKYMSVYCHWDGYPSHNGRLLLENYNTLPVIMELLSFGDISSLGSKVHPDGGQPHSFDNPQNSVTVYYGRDRNEDDVAFNVYDKYEHVNKEEYNYLFEDGKWYVDGKLLTQELCEED